MLNILLVEDDEHFASAVSEVLAEQKWKVTHAADGRAARELIKVSAAFDVIVSDIQMPFLTGVELLEWVKANRPTPFVLMTGFALIMETQKAHDLGADDFLPKPFESDELVDVIKRVCAKKLAEFAPAKVIESPDVFCKVSLEEFVTSPTLTFDVHVKLGERLVKVGRKGDPVPADRIKGYAQKGLKHLYVRKDDFRNLVSFNLSMAKVVTGAGTVDKEKKANFLRYTGEVVLEKAFVAGLDKDSFDEAKDFLSTSMDVLSDEPSALSLLTSFNEHADFIYAHSLCVSVYSVLIAKNLGWSSTQNLFKLSLAGILHDIGKKEIDAELLIKPRPLLSYAERQTVETHAARGRDILATIKQIPSEAIEVAAQHHEDNLGSGYPARLSKMQIHPYAQIVRVANLFAELAVKSPVHPGMPPDKAIEHIQNHYGEAVSANVFKALKALFEPQKAKAG